jgi:hypothetical protein
VAKSTGRERSAAGRCSRGSGGIATTAGQAARLRVGALSIRRLRTCSRTGLVGRATSARLDIPDKPRGIHAIAGHVDAEREELQPSLQVLKEAQPLRR